MSWTGYAHSCHRPERPTGIAGHNPQQGLATATRCMRRLSRLASATGMCLGSVRPQGEQLVQLPIAQPADPLLAGTDGHVGEAALGLDHVVDALFEGVAREQAVDLHGAGLADAKEGKHR